MSETCIVDDARRLHLDFWAHEDGKHDCSPQEDNDA
jgi:hypothetical protein